MSIKNTVRNRLQAGQLAVGMGLSRLRMVDTASIVKASGFDWLFIDMEHSSIDLDQAAQMCMAALPTGITPLVRVPSKLPHHMTKILDGGAMGVVIPHVDTPEQAREIVSACKYPPIGHRSLYGVLPQLEYASMPTEQALTTLNDLTFIVLMLESPQAIANADAIAAIDGVDALLIGTSDLTAESGVPGQIDHPIIKEAYAKTIAACHQHGKFPGMGGVYNNELLEEYIGMGMRLILAGSDVSFMMAAARGRTEFLNGLTL